MRKCSFVSLGILAILVLAMSCTDGGRTEREREDSNRMEVASAQEEAAKAAAEQARVDSIRQDSINNATAGLTFQMFCKPEKIEGISLQSFLSFKQIKSNLEALGFSETGTEKKKERAYDWTPEDPTYYTKTITTFSKSSGENTTTVRVGGSDGDVDEVKIDFPKDNDVLEFKSTVKGKLRDDRVSYWATKINYSGTRVTIKSEGAE